MDAGQALVIISYAVAATSFVALGIGYVWMRRLDRQSRTLGG